MRVEMVTLAAGPNGTLDVGHVYEVTKDLGQTLIDAGAAKLAADDAVVTPSPMLVVPATATDAPQRPRRSAPAHPSGASSDPAAGASTEPAKPPAKRSAAKRRSSRRGTRS